MNFERYKGSPDSAELRFLGECLKDCRCCGVCSIAPCAGVTAGGFCDELCSCNEGRDEDYDDE